MRSLLTVANLVPRKAGTFEAYLSALGRRCRASGVRCGLLLPGDPIPAVADDFRAAGVEWWVAPDWPDAAGKPRFRPFVRAYLRALREGPWDVAVFQFCKELAVSAGSLLARARGLAPAAAVWVQQSGMRPPGRLGRYASRLRVLARFVDGMVVLGGEARAAVVARGWPAARVAVVGNGCPVPPAPRRGWVRPELGLPDGAVLLACVGTLIPRKGYDVLLRAVGPLLAGRPERHLLVVGDGPDRAALEALAADQGVRAQVRFLGLRNDAAALVADADLFVLASRAEGLSFALLEALAAAVPVVATAVGDHRAVVTPETGLLVPPGDAEALRAAVAAALDDLPTARARAAAGRALVARDFSVDRQVEDQFRVFQNVWEGSRAAARRARGG
jgi:glycosyltransferase involved in cell wall biosynthesis